MERYKLLFKIEKDQSYLRILGESFFKRNQASGYFIYQNVGYILKDKIKTKKIKEKEIKIIMVFYKQIINKKYMFKDCESLIKFSLSETKKKEVLCNITTISEEEDNNLIGNYMEDNILNKSFNDFLEEFDTFPESSVLSNNSEIDEKKKKGNKSNKSTIKNIFNNLRQIPDNLINLCGMFFNCSSLLYFPDISEWDMEKVSDISYLFYKCSSLKSLPDISNWNTENINNIEGLFADCSSLKSLPDISRWNTINMTNINCIFCGCSSLVFLPDISKWDTNKVVRMRKIFFISILFT